MRRMLIPLAGLMLLSVVGCHCVQGKCDCDFTPTLGCHVYDVKVYGLRGCGDGAPVAAVGAAELVPVAPTPVKPEAIKEMPRVAPDKEEEQQQ